VRQVPVGEDMKGHFVAYQPKKFRQDALDLIAAANKIIDEYRGAITLRQLYYQFVARGLLENKVENYNRLGALISDGRMAGLVSWTAIEDRGRNLLGYETFSSPSKAIDWLAEEHYRIDLWADQPFRPEVWVEKAALEGVLATICNELRVDFFACRGYNSQSEQWRAGRRLARYISKGQTPIIFHLGDHDPSGIDMTRDNRDRLSLFAGIPINVQRIALNMPQIERYNPPPNPAKSTDSRFEDYQRKFGDESWELDALAPNVIHDLIRDAIMRIRDHAKWDAMLKMEAEDKIVLQQFAEDANDNQADEE
jgi:hypothetical protein